MRFNSFILSHSSKLIHVNSFISCISFHFNFTSFHLTMNSYKQCLFFETSAPARAGHYLVDVSVLTFGLWTGGPSTLAISHHPQFMPWSMNCTCFSGIGSLAALPSSWTPIISFIFPHSHIDLPLFSRQVGPHETVSEAIDCALHRIQPAT